MAKSKKRPLLWASGLIALVLAGLAMYAYFVSTRTLLERAEAFAYRRMSVPRLGDGGDFRFFYVTNRQAGEAHPEASDDGSEADVAAGVATVADRYTAKREDTLKFGAFDTAIEATQGLGMVIDPSLWFLNKEIRLRRIGDLEREAFIAELRAQVQASPRHSLLLVVNGFREAFPSALRKTAFLAHVLDIDTPVLLFDWPGNQGSSLRGYRRARRIARASGAELAATLKLVINEVQPERLWLIANSMGGQVVADAFHELNRDANFVASATPIENLVMTAPDVNHEEFNRKFSREMKLLTDNVTVYVSSNDRALLVARVINRGHRLGESYLDPENPGQVEQATAVSDLLEPGSNRLVLVDVTPINRTRNFHNFSLERPEFFDDLFQRFTSKVLPISRELYSVKTPRGSTYFVLTRSR